MKDKIELRKFDEADLEQVLDLAISAFTPIHESFRNILGPEIFKAKWGNWIEEHKTYITSIANQTIEKELFVGVLDTKVVAFVAFFMDLEKSWGTIDINAVDPNYQGQSFGTKNV